VVHRARLDAELVRRGLARSREQAVAVIAEGRVRVGGLVATKPATGVDPGASVTVEAPAGDEYVSRGGHKLAGALDVFAASQPPLEVESRRALDAGASTGGFTDVLLRRGAAHVVAVDVGYGQLAWSVRSDPRVTVLDRTNVRDLTLDLVGEPAGLVVADLSFISLTTVLPALRAVTTPDADYVLMVKPQFEVGRGNVGSGGVVRDPALRAGAIRTVAAAALTHGLGVRGVTASPLPGPAGNVEYFLWLAAGAPRLDDGDADRAVAEGPA
jgi:23S rRNA (cytidine1920-2'-O)/16S rRNA (cytidine1409-2'-O)-methyltransferase